MIHAKRLTLLVLCALLVLPIVGCATDDEGEEGDGSELHTVIRGSLIVDVSASGNLAFSTEEDLAFDMAGTVEDVFVEEGDPVTAEQVLATLDTSDWEEQLRSLRMSVLSAQIGLEQAEYALEQAEAETIITITGDVVVKDCCDDEDIEIKEMQVEQAELKLEDAEAKLDEHLALSPETVAPFDGFVTRVNIEGGDEVMKGHVAATIADPNEFEALILVGENDIARVMEGTQAEVEIDAMSGVALPAEVTAIAPTATISSGVVNYEVTVKVASLEEARAQMEEAQARQEAASGEMLDRLKQAIEAGEITEEEAQAMMEEMESGGFTPSAAGGTSVIEDIELRQGLNVSVTLLIAQKSDVLLVPNAAIGTEGNRAFVTVLAEDGSEEQRQITTGISNWQFTEVTAGLQEGEVIKTYGSPAPTSDGDRPGGMFMMGGGPPR